MNTEKKNYNFMKKIVALFSLVVLFACGSSKSTKSISYQVLTDSGYLGKKTQSYEVIDNHDDLKKFYDIFKDELLHISENDNSRVMAYLIEKKNTELYTIEIESVKQEKGKVIVKVKKSYPDGIATMTFTQPYMIAKIDTTRQIEFE